MTLSNAKRLKAISTMQDRLVTALKRNNGDVCCENCVDQANRVLVSTKVDLLISMQIAGEL